jgi:hypothetical protein
VLVEVYCITRLAPEICAVNTIPVAAVSTKSSLNPTLDPLLLINKRPTRKSAPLLIEYSRMLYGNEAAVYDIAVAGTT